ncbi:serine/threonine-protein kinase [Myxococcus sp. RHSTA-1-4]|uniref:serine/threonine-protein kinase n=1 Tax=Myxococcus sp. RHSTA-1-4 TaxID=2874601 RepID=UPI001CC16044|nr:serine/threonine-protein kinase [Myxococcus sp. RHSTA-1-4]MBZ4419843.1 protein kinase [Myxococcus sp. RHSTA-1-4]
MMTTQACPNCGTQHDIRVYVTGQKATCRCGIRFEVRRGDTPSAVGSRNTVVPGASGVFDRNSRVGVSPPAGSGVGTSSMSSHEASRGLGNNVTVVPGGAPEGTFVSAQGQGAASRPAPAGSGVSVQGIGVSAVRPTPAQGSGVAGPEEADSRADDESFPPSAVPLPGVAAPSDATSGVALPSDVVGREAPVEPTVVRSSAKTGKGSANSDLGDHDLSTFVTGGKVDLPGFELMEMLGRGGMGEVWLARQQSLGRTVAVKLLPPRLAKDPEFVTRFEKEATALAALNHPHIIQIIDRGVAGEHYFFVMEYVEGRSLREAMSAGLTPERGLKILLAVARAIECAHDKGIIHRDLKPENILLDGRGHVKVADFGLAGIRAQDSRLQLTATAVAMGTLNYMAPEQRRDAKNVDGRADLFSLGVMLYEVLTGELPLGRFKLPSAKVPGLDPRVDAVVERLLETEPEARYARAGELAAELEAMVSATSAPGLSQGDVEGRVVPAAARPASNLSRRVKAGWRRARAGLSVVGGLALLGIAVQWLVGPVSVHVGKGDKVVIGTQGVTVRAGEKQWPPNTYGEVFTSVNLVEPAKPGGASRFEVGFDKGEEELNVHSGQWTLVDGQLRAVQGGKETNGKRLVPRAYVAHRYFSTNDFRADVVMDVKPLGKQYPEEPDAQHYGELALRIKDLQVSAFAIPEAGMRLAWRYFTEDGQEVVGNSALDTDNLVEDEMPLPKHGPYLVGLRMQRAKNGVLVEAFLNNQRFARKLLPGLEDRVGKVALGCRNLECTFDDLKVRGVLESRPQRKVAGGAE